jgi:hypothetical protein
MSDFELYLHVVGVTILKSKLGHRSCTESGPRCHDRSTLTRGQKGHQRVAGKNLAKGYLPRCTRLWRKAESSAARTVPAAALFGLPPKYHLGITLPFRGY